MSIHGRLLKALLTAPEPCTLAGAGADGAALVTRHGAGLVLLDGETAGVQERIRAAMARHRSGLLHLVLAGGSQDERRVLKSAWPFWQMSRQLAFHQVDRDWKYHHVRGPRLAIVEEAAKRAPSLDPPGPEELVVHDAKAAAVAREQEEFARAVSGTPWVTYAVVLVCVAVFVLQELWGGSSSPLALSRMGANPGHAAWRAPWTLLSSAFLHIGLPHLVLNMAALLSFGPLLERVLGWRRYLVLYALSALGGALASAVGHPAVLSAGASGALWGLMAGGAGLAYRPRDLLPPSLVGPMRKQVWRPVVINVIYSLQPGVDLLAHLGGGLTGGALLLSGLLTIGVARDGATITRSSGRWLQAASALSALAMAASLTAALAVGSPWTLRTVPPLERRAIAEWGLSIEVPRGFAMTREEHVVRFGTLEHDPVAVEVIYAAADAARSDEDLRGYRGEFKTMLENLKVQGATRQGGVTEEHVGTLDTFRVDDKFNAVVARTWAAPLARGDVLVRVYVHPAAPPAWAALRDRFIASLRVEP